VSALDWRIFVALLAGVCSAARAQVTFTTMANADAFVCTGSAANPAGADLGGTNFGAAGMVAIAPGSSPKGEFQGLVKFPLTNALSLFNGSFGAGDSFRQRRATLLQDALRLRALKGGGAAVAAEHRELQRDLLRLSVAPPGQRQFPARSFGLGQAEGLAKLGARVVGVRWTPLFGQQNAENKLGSRVLRHQCSFC
jgi:hypothetical protein